MTSSLTTFVPLHAMHIRGRMGFALKVCYATRDEAERLATELTKSYPLAHPVEAYTCTHHDDPRSRPTASKHWHLGRVDLPATDPRYRVPRPPTYPPRGRERT